jgi:hypothetical protein
LGTYLIAEGPGPTPRPFFLPLFTNVLEQKLSQVRTI